MAARGTEGHAGLDKAAESQTLLFSHFCDSVSATGLGDLGSGRLTVRQLPLVVEVRVSGSIQTQPQSLLTEGLHWGRRACLRPALWPPVQGRLEPRRGSWNFPGLRKQCVIFLKPLRVNN